MWVKKGGEEVGWAAGGEFPRRCIPDTEFFPVGPTRAPVYWLDLRENALSLLISGPDSSTGGRGTVERSQSCSGTGVEVRYAERDGRGGERRV